MDNIRDLYKNIKRYNINFWFQPEEGREKWAA